MNSKWEQVISIINSHEWYFPFILDHFSVIFRHFSVISWSFLTNSWKCAYHKIIHTHLCTVNIIFSFSFTVNITCSHSLFFIYCKYHLFSFNLFRSHLYMKNYCTLIHYCSCLYSKRMNKITITITIYNCSVPVISFIFSTTWGLCHQACYGCNLPFL